MYKIKLLVFLSCILTACASTPRIDYDLDSSYDLSKYVTYSIKYEEFNDPSQISLNPILIQRVERAIENHLEAKNFKISDNPDFIIKVLVGTDREINKSYESSSFLYPRHGWGDVDTRYYRVDKDAIAIRAYDGITNEVVWYSFSRFKKSSLSKDQDAIDSLISKMLTSFLN